MLVHHRSDNTTCSQQERKNLAVQGDSVSNLVLQLSPLHSTTMFIWTSTAKWSLICYHSPVQSWLDFPCSLLMWHYATHCSTGMQPTVRLVNISTICNEAQLTSLLGRYSEFKSLADTTVKLKVMGTAPMLVSLQLSISRVIILWEGEAVSSTVNSQSSYKGVPIQLLRFQTFHNLCCLQQTLAN